MAKSDAKPESFSPAAGKLETLSPEQVVPSKNNPRRLFDEGPLADLRENIRRHGVLVPITVYPLKGQLGKFGILDGERRHKCVVDLAKRGIFQKLPANIVEPPSKVAGLLYMFSIHGFREQWELMPTALSLETVMRELGEEDPKKLSNLTGLSLPQIERCKKLLQFPKHFQDMSLDLDPRTRVPSNFWIEVLPVIELVRVHLPELTERLTRNGVTQKLVDKYRAKRIKSVIHFRRVVEAFEFTDSPEKKAVLVDTLRRYVLDLQLETREAFDEFVVDNRRVQNAIAACQTFLGDLRKYKLQFVTDKDELISSLKQVSDYISYLQERLTGNDPPPTPEGPEEDEGR